MRKSWNSRSRFRELLRCEQQNRLTLVLLLLVVLFAIWGFWPSREVNPSSFRVILNSNLTYKAGWVNILAKNERANGCNMQIRLFDENQKLLASCELKKGQSQDYLKLSGKLKPGVYPAKVFVDALSAETGRALFSISRAVKISNLPEDE